MCCGSIPYQLYSLCTLSRSLKNTFFAARMYQINHTPKCTFGNVTFFWFDLQVVPLFCFCALHCTTSVQCSTSHSWGEVSIRMHYRLMRVYTVVTLQVWTHNVLDPCSGSVRDLGVIGRVCSCSVVAPTHLSRTEDARLVLWPYVWGCEWTHYGNGRTLQWANCVIKLTFIVVSLPLRQSLLRVQRKPAASQRPLFSIRH